jgi:hypothetical protein
MEEGPKTTEESFIRSLVSVQEAAPTSAALAALLPGKPVWPDTQQNTFLSSGGGTFG